MLHRLWRLLANRIIRPSAVTAGPLHPLGGHESWKPEDTPPLTV